MISELMRKNEQETDHSPRGGAPSAGGRSFVQVQGSRADARYQARSGGCVRFNTQKERKDQEPRRDSHERFYRDNDARLRHAPRVHIRGLQGAPYDG